MAICFVVRRGDIIYADKVPIIKIISGAIPGRVTVQSLGVLGIAAKFSSGVTHKLDKAGKRAHLALKDKVILPYKNSDLMITRISTGLDRQFSTRISCRSFNGSIVFSVGSAKKYSNL